jgi:GTP pyrophosphokinase
MPKRPSPPVRLSSRFERALALANQLHRKQARKGTRIPYVAHLLGVASLALEHGAIEDEAIAALLHDAVEDQGGKKTRERIRRRFGEKVARLVDECSDTDTVPKPPWKERKERYIAHLGKASPGALLVSAADKLHNVRSLVSDYHVVGEALWGRFKGGREGTLWNYRALVDAYRKAGAPAALVDELDRTVKELERLARPLPPSISSGEIDELTRQGGREGIAEDEKLIEEVRGTKERAEREGRPFVSNLPAEE